MEEEEEDIIADYTLTLEDLTSNSKPHINALTILAEENQKEADKIVMAIESRLKEVPANEKLYLLYLIDSIIKNLPHTSYLNLFNKNIVALFTDVFEKVDEQTRVNMFKLRQTWPQLFPNNTLLSLDVSVKCLDPHWPVTAQQPGDNVVGLDGKETTKVEVVGQVVTSGVKTSTPQQIVSQHLLQKQQMNQQKHLNSQQQHLVQQQHIIQQNLALRQPSTPLIQPNLSHINPNCLPLPRHSLPSHVSNIHINPAIFKQGAIKDSQRVDKHKHTSDVADVKKDTPAGDVVKNKMADKKSGKTKKLGLRDPRNEVRTHSAENIKKRKMPDVDKKKEKKEKKEVRNEEAKEEEGDEVLSESQLRSQLLAKQQELLQLQWKRIEMQLNTKQKQTNDEDEDTRLKETSPENTDHKEDKQKSDRCLKQEARKKNMEVARSLLNKFKGAGINPLKNKSSAKNDNRGNDSSGGDKDSKNVDKMLTSANLKGFVIPKKNNKMNNKNNNDKNNEKNVKKKQISEENNKNNKKRKNVDGIVSDPRLKKQKKSKSEDRTSISPDIRDLFGNEDKDHRLKPKALLPPPLPSYLSPQSPACTQASGWASFKASHPSNYTSNFHPLCHQYHNTPSTNEADNANNNKKRKALLPTPELLVDKLNEDDKEQYNMTGNKQMTDQQRHDHLRQIQVELVRERDRLQSMDGDVHTPIREFKRKINMRRDLLDEEMLDMENPKWYNQNSGFNNPPLLPAPPKFKSNHYEGYRHRPHVRRDLSWDIHHDNEGFNKGDKYYNQEYENYRGFPSRHPLPPPPLSRPPYPPHNLMNDRFYNRKRFDDYEDGDFYSDYNGDEYFFDGDNSSFKGASNQENVPLINESNPQFQSNNQGSNNDQSNANVNSSNQSKNNNPASNIDVQSLFSKLVEFGMIGGQPAKQPSATNEIVESKVRELPDLTTFDMTLLKKSYRPIPLFYQPSPSSSSSSSCKSFQCSSCGLTFPPRSSTGALINQRYKTHLDWHFNNKKQKYNGMRTRKLWKYSLDWVQSKSFNPISYINSDKLNADQAGEEDEKDDVSNKENPESQEVRTDDDDDVIATLASKNADDRCQLCNDKFDYYWSDQKDAWLLSDAVLHADRLLHRLCLPDYLNMISNNEGSKEAAKSENDNDNNKNNISEVVIDVKNDSFGNDDDNKNNKSRGDNDVVLVDDDDDEDDVKICEQKTDEIGDNNDNKMIDNDIKDDNLDKNTDFDNIHSPLTTTNTTDNNTTTTLTTTNTDNNNNITTTYDEYNTTSSVNIITVTPDDET